MKKKEKQRKKRGAPSNCAFVVVRGSENEKGWKKFRCKRCKLLTNHTPSPAHKIFCKCKRPNRLVIFLYKIAHYWRAVRYWNKHGRPMRGKAEVDRIFKICQGCPEFDPERSSCHKCGCRVNGGANALSNKIAMATQHCPLEKW